MSLYKKLNEKEGGFTIIEVVLVLAIAGLIFLIVFLALPQLQRSRRDTQRKNDAGRILASLEGYAQNNNGRYPAGDAVGFEAFMDSYFHWDEAETSDLPEMFDPSKGNYTVKSNAGDPVAGELKFEDGDCAGANTGSRTRSVKVGLEQGGVFCQDNR